MDSTVKTKACYKELDVESIRKDFPILGVKVHGKPLVYFDNAATSQKPLFVLKLLKNIIETVNSNVHRGVHHLSSLLPTSLKLPGKQLQHTLMPTKMKLFIPVAPRNPLTL